MVTLYELVVLGLFINGAEVCQLVVLLAIDDQWEYGSHRDALDDGYGSCCPDPSHPLWLSISDHDRDLDLLHVAFILLWMWTRILTPASSSTRGERSSSHGQHG